MNACTFILYTDFLQNKNSLLNALQRPIISCKENFRKPFEFQVLGESEVKVKENPVKCINIDVHNYWPPLQRDLGSSVGKGRVKDVK